MSETQSGSCLCGHIGFVTKGQPNTITNCHCRICQKASGAPYITWVEFPAAMIAWTGAEPQWRQSSEQGERGFCPRCGGAVAFRYLAGDAIDLSCVLFDEPDTFAPEDEIWADSRREWVMLSAQLPRHPRDRR